MLISQIRDNVIKNNNSDIGIDSETEISITDIVLWSPHCFGIYHTIANI